MPKIPFLDEVYRSVQSLGDAISGNPERARKRWENYFEDSVIGTATAATSVAIASPVVAIFDREEAADMIEFACSRGEKLAATSVSAVSRSTSRVAQGLTFGIPSPVSGFLSGYADGIDKVIAEDAKSSNDHVSWEEVWKESSIGAVKGAVSSGGVIPFAGKLTENAIREGVLEETLTSDQEEYDLAEELSGAAKALASSPWGKEVLRDLSKKIK